MTRSATHRSSRSNRKQPTVFEGRRKLPPAPLGRDFCKTAQKPYDVVVCAALLAIKHHQRDNVEICSDGEFDDEWQPAYQLYRNATGRELPPEFREYEDQDELLTTSAVEPRKPPRATRRFKTAPPVELPEHKNRRE